MLRYVCKNQNCLNTFLSHDLDIFKKCESCGEHLVHVGKPDKQGETDYPPPETKEELKAKYIKLREKKLRIGLLKSECLTVGRAIRKLSFQERKQLLQEHGLWEEGIIYKHMMTEGDLLKIVVDKRAMYYQKKKGKKNEQDNRN